jgi:uncharacterized membrane protein YeiB
MTLRRLSVLQWFGLLGAALAWTGVHVIGYGVAQAKCSTVGGRWDIAHDTWQVTLAAVGVVIVLAAEAAAIAVFRATRAADDQDPPPDGRLHFFATAAVVANVIFLVIIVLDGLGSTLDTLCRQS